MCMKKKLTDSSRFEPVCRICRHGRLSPDGESVLCIKKGIVDPDGKCRRYVYDPLKRIPKKALQIESADPSEFEL
ncbi:MAG: hypothetical protein J6A60_06145 [Clostridia bacterium]|nr:hypothetical protein [Clostridia bacterium]